jgi:uncharacterized protein YjdB
VSGTVGQARQIEAIQINVNPTLRKHVMYKVYLQDIGWTDWVRNNEIAGTTGQGRRLEAIILSIK